jgi:hypothetical protein
MLEGTRDAGARALVVVLFAIGVGSWLFHTHAQVWAAVADVVPIQIFILRLSLSRDGAVLRAAVVGGRLAVGCSCPTAFLLAQGVGALFGPLNSSVGYVPVPILIAAYGLALWRRAPDRAGL